MVDEKTYDISIDPADLTLGELVDLERASGQTFSEIQLQLAMNNFHASTLVGLVWISERRRNPEFTLEDARAVKVTLVKGPDVGEEPDGADGAGVPGRAAGPPQ